MTTACPAPARSRARNLPACAPGGLSRSGVEPVSRSQMSPSASLRKAAPVSPCLLERPHTAS
jgi:hypothetical protein